MHGNNKSTSCLINTVIYVLIFNRFDSFEPYNKFNLPLTLLYKLHVSNVKKVEVMLQPFPQHLLQ